MWFNAYMVKQNKQSKLPIITLIIASLSLAIGLFVSYCFFTYIHSSQATDNMNAQSHFESTIKLMQLEECYEHNIRPCSQETIAKYYEAQPEEQ